MLLSVVACTLLRSVGSTFALYFQYTFLYRSQSLITHLAQGGLVRSNSPPLQIHMCQVNKGNNKQSIQTINMRIWWRWGQCPVPVILSIVNEPLSTFLVGWFFILLFHPPPPPPFCFPREHFPSLRVVTAPNRFSQRKYFPFFLLFTEITKYDEGPQHFSSGRLGGKGGCDSVLFAARLCLGSCRGLWNIHGINIATRCV